MKRIICVIMAIAIMLFIMGCSGVRKPYCPTYADSRDTSNHIGIAKYNTVVSLKGDTTFLPVPYTPTKGERIASNTVLFSIASVIVFALSTYEK